MGSRVLDVVDVHTYYGESHVLHGVTLTVADGEVLTILGRNGMGKTTLIRSIIGFTPPRRGTVRFKGEDILTLIRDVHSRLGSTVVIVTHDMSVAGSCERTIALRDGKVVEDIRR